jgi:hypothetical protein
MKKFIDAFISDMKSTVSKIGDAIKTKNIPSYYDNEYGIYMNVINWHPDTASIDEPNIDGKFVFVDTKNGTTEAEMRQSAVKMSRKQAGAKFAQMILDGEFDKNQTYRNIFLNETRGGVPLELLCGRLSGGRLYLYVSEVNPGRRCFDVGYAWFASNEPLKS